MRKEKVVDRVLFLKVWTLGKQMQDSIANLLCCLAFIEQLSHAVFLS